MADYEDALAYIAGEKLPRLRTSLGHRFPKMAEAVVEEVLQDTLAEACDPARDRWFREGLETGGRSELERRIYTAGWRRLRGEHRRVSNKRSARMPTGYDAVGMDQADEGAQMRELGSFVGHRIDDAADQFGRARRTTLHRALKSLFRAGHPVKPLAERYSLPRRYLAEASSWLRKQIAGRDKE